MPFYPPFNFPFYFNNYKNHRMQNNQNVFNTTNFDTGNFSNNHCTNNNFNSNTKNSNIINNLSIKEKPQYEEKASETTEASEAFFEIFGLKIYFDDILIICILFFLYTENVRDDELFICLILLLLT